MKITYNISVKPKELSRTILHSLDYKQMFVSDIEFEFETCQFEVKLTGKGDLLCVNESVFLYQKKFSIVNTVVTQSLPLLLDIKYVGKDYKSLQNVKAIVTYSKYEPKLLYCNIYDSLDEEGLNNILNDIKKILQSNLVNNIIFSSDKKLNSFNLQPKFTCDEEELLQTYNETSTNNIINYNVPSFFKDVVTDYTLSVDVEQAGKLGVSIYGF